MTSSISVDTGSGEVCLFGEKHAFLVEPDGRLVIRRLGDNGRDWEICAVFAPGRWDHVRQGVSP